MPGSTVASPGAFISASATASPAAAAAAAAAAGMALSKFVQPAEVASLKQLTSFNDAELEAIYAIFATRQQAVCDF
jgi:hypothetical protein